MTDATDLWDAVVVAYPAQALVELTNPDARAATTANTAFGQTAAQAAIDLWPLYAQEDYDAADARHVQVGISATIAMLNRRGGTSTKVEQIAWEEVFGPEGMLTRLRRTGPRGRMAPAIGGNTQRATEGSSDGTPRRPWSDPDALPYGIAPRNRTANEDD